MYARCQGWPDSVPLLMQDREVIEFGGLWDAPFLLSTLSGVLEASCFCHIFACLCLSLHQSRDAIRHWLGGLLIRLTDVHETATLSQQMLSNYGSLAFSP